MAKKYKQTIGGSEKIQVETFSTLLTARIRPTWSMGLKDRMEGWDNSVGMSTGSSLQQCWKGKNLRASGPRGGGATMKSHDVVDLAVGCVCHSQGHQLMPLPSRLHFKKHTALTALEHTASEVLTLVDSAAYRRAAELNNERQLLNTTDMISERSSCASLLYNPSPSLNLTVL